MSQQRTLNSLNTTHAWAHTHTVTNTHIPRITRGHTSKTTKFLFSGIHRRSLYFAVKFVSSFQQRLIYFPLLSKAHHLQLDDHRRAVFDSSEQVLRSCLFLAPFLPALVPWEGPSLCSPANGSARAQNLPLSRNAELAALILPPQTSDFKEHGLRSLE